jgi:hypothetical protein
LFVWLVENSACVWVDVTKFVQKLK